MFSWLDKFKKTPAVPQRASYSLDQLLALYRSITLERPRKDPVSPLTTAAIPHHDAATFASVMAAIPDLSSSKRCPRCQ